MVKGKKEGSYQIKRLLFELELSILQLRVVQKVIDDREEELCTLSHNLGHNNEKKQ